MSIEEDVTLLLHEIQRRAQSPFPVGTINEEIDALGERLNMRIPEELRAWLLLCNAPLIGPGGLFGICPERDFLDIDMHLSLFPAWHTKGWIPVASDGAGDYYVLATGPTTSSRHPVLFVDQSNYDVPAYAVASDLWHFLRFLFNEELGNTSYWPFDAQEVLANDPELALLSDAPLPWNAE